MAYDGTTGGPTPATSTSSGGGGFDWGGLFDLAGGALDTFTYTEQERSRDELGARTQLELAQMQQQQSSGGLDSSTMMLAGGAVLLVVLFVALK